MHPPRSRVHFAALALLVALFGGGCPAGREEPIQVSVLPGAERAPASPEEILELARAEGELTWYTSLPQAAAERLLDAFTDQYPFIRARLVRGGSFTIAERIHQERQAGRVQADVLHVLDPATFVRLRQEGGLLHYDSPEARDIPPAYRDAGYWASLRAVTLGLAVSPRYASGDRAVNAWEDLLRPEFRGRLGLKDAETAGAAYAFHFLLRERFGTVFWERLARQDPRIYKTEAQMLQAVNQGEVDVAAGVMGLSEDGVSQPDDGVEFVFPAEGVPMMVGPVGILEAAPHPNCGRLFVDYLLGREGQELISSTVGAYSLRPGVTPPLERQPLQRLTLLVPSAGWSDYAGKRELLRAEFAELLGPAGE